MTVSNNKLYEDNKFEYMVQQESNLESALEMGLTKEEYNLICTKIKKIPNKTELGIFSAMFSEHCSYKSSKKWLKTMPTEASHVIQGPGENAGVIDIGDGLAAIFKIESHNHPSFIEPYQGSATGVGGILRDVFTMGARPIALLNALRFGSASKPLTKHLLSGVVKGIGGYGNCIGIPTVGGETNFDKSYDGNILVNAMAVGLADKDKIFYSAATGANNPVIYVGAKTGRDGIHGATMASAEFTDSSSEKRPTVQVGDPFTGKLLLEACLELMNTDAVLSIQDMGAAGLTSSSVEMASKGSLGMFLDLDLVPTREEQMTSYEIMLSESQERMLMILKPGSENKAKLIFDKWDLDFAVIGKVTDTGRLVLNKNGFEACNIPINPLVEDAPEYDRPYEIINNKKIIDLNKIVINKTINEILVKVFKNPNMASKKWIWEQYDCSVMGDTILSSGQSDAAIVKIHGTENHNSLGKGLAMTTDCTPRYVKANPFEGGMQAVCEAARNIAASGAKPLAITNNLNFGNPEKKHIMGEIVGAIKGISKAASYLNTPIVSGNVSLYNETNGNGILPTPVIGMVGIINKVENCLGVNSEEGNTLLVLGQSEEFVEGWISSSIYQEIINNEFDGAPPPINLENEKEIIDIILKLNEEKLITAAHDISDGGLLPTICEMLFKNNLGIDLNLPDLLSKKDSKDILLHSWCFGEDQGRVIVATKNLNKVKLLLKKYNIKFFILGEVNSSSNLNIKNVTTISINDIKNLYENTLTSIMC
ncbi:phosphoribosylformylglycinamidine synthase subunit PurL [Alphaproteobacteria bacterium]|jgi:phosphoribosylformylglycinamidine synthase|nr:phosphoribosylformylglycinamidine synthase subunit PurL [Alphaproteobacteria bacterium]MDB3916480.1 phosphoribosylformylglycinamidine synthase subunit PurL [Alphaproteobacteria bacterium]